MFISWGEGTVITAEFSSKEKCMAAVVEAKKVFDDGWRNIAYVCVEK